MTITEQKVESPAASASGSSATQEKKVEKEEKMMPASPTHLRDYREGEQ